MSHYLVITEPGEDYEIEHDPDCPRVDWLLDPEGNKIQLEDCLLGRLVHEAGLEDNGIEWRALPAGRYEIEAWTQRSPSGPWGPEEWDAGIQFCVAEQQTI